MRFSAFTADLDIIPLEEWWTQITGANPTDISNKPQQLEYNVVGEYENLLFGISRKGNKIDFIANSKEVGKDNQPREWGIYADGSKLMGSIVKKWSKLKSLPSITRIAHGARLTQYVESFEEGHKVLGNYISDLQLDLQKVKDFNFQINRPRDSKSYGTDLVINRFNKWSLIENISFEIEAAASGVAKNTHLTIYKCQLDLDINSKFNVKRKISKSKIHALFEEFLDLGLETVREGDKP